MSEAVINRLIDQRVVDALAEYETNRNSNPRNVNEDGSHDSGLEMEDLCVRTARECTYKEFLNYQPLNFKGTEGVVGLTYALMWWNSHVKIVGHDAAYGMPWRTLIKMMTDKYCPRSEIIKLEIELWNLKVKGTDVVSYTQRFHELALMCGRMLPEESDQRHADNKRRLDNNPGDNHDQQPPFKRKNVARAYTSGPEEKKFLAGANNQRTLTCFEYGNQWHYMSDCPELKNQNCGNQAGSSEARGRVYALGGGGETDQDPNNIEDEIEA
ncbi:RNA polymerase beta subunit, chloroplastic [Tanacetum coccineum]